MKKKILIIGKNGYIAKNLIKYLSCKNINLFICSYSENSLIKIFRKVDTIKPEVVIPLFGSGTTYHASKNIKKANKENYLDYKKLISFLIKKEFVKKIILPSSAAVYADNKQKMMESGKKKPKNIYGKQKLKMEQYVEKICLKKKLDKAFIILRIFSVFGPKMYKQLIFDAFQKFAKNNQPYFFGDGEQVRDYIHINDLNNLFFFLIKNKNLPSLSFFNIGTGKGIRINLVIKLISNYFFKKKYFYKNNILENNNKYLVADSRSINKLGWRAKIDFRKSLTSVLKSYEN